jgi:hypothetical protein
LKTLVSKEKNLTRKMTGFLRAIEGVQEKEKEEERQSKLTRESEFFNGERRATTFDISLL